MRVAAHGDVVHLKHRDAAVVQRRTEALGVESPVARAEVRAEKQKEATYRRHRQRGAMQQRAVGWRAVGAARR